MKESQVQEVSLEETEDFDAMRSLARRSGLEGGKFDDIAVAYGCYAGEQLMGCAALKRLGEAFSVEWLAVDSSRRNEGIVRMIVERIASEVRDRGATRLWALARAPDFFLRIGFLPSSPEASPGPTLAACHKCAQYDATCIPKMVVKNL
ncbi:MAG: GNAT family N-acetyltransferase [Methanobacteriota archaeon]|nr:MAG: GNAT family N-acetyltransferase [Euryarchaeota archaeon]